MDCCRGHIAVAICPRDASPHRIRRPVRANPVSGRGMMKIASLPVATVFLAGGEHVNAARPPRASALPSAIAPSYLWTHAFLI